MSVSQHTIRCKSNPKYKPAPQKTEKWYEAVKANKASVYNSRASSGECRYCRKYCKNGNSLNQHEIRCPGNYNRIKSVGAAKTKKWKLSMIRRGDEGNNLNQFSYAKKHGMPAPMVLNSTRIKLKEKEIGRTWSSERRNAHSKTMKKAVLNNPNSYNSQNRNGKVTMEIYKGANLNKWEIDTAKYLEKLGIKWTHQIEKPFEYEWAGKKRLYYPDFYLEEYDRYIEVKGRIWHGGTREKSKWSQVPALIVIKVKEINAIRRGEDIDELIKLIS